MPRSISCDAHDYFEIACTFHYDIVVALRDGGRVAGRANTTRTTDGLEYLVLHRADVQHTVAMHDVATLEVRTPNARFQSLTLDAAGSIDSVR